MDAKMLSDLMEKTVHKYVRLEKTIRCYANGIPMTQTEIHTVVAIGDNPHINVTGLARAQGITKGAASQMVYKLVDKGFVVKRTSPTSDSEVVLSLTDLGKRAYEGHAEYHRTTTTQFFKILQDMPDETADKMTDLLRDFDSMLDEALDKDVRIKPE